MKFSDKKELADSKVTEFIAKLQSVRESLRYAQTRKEPLLVCAVNKCIMKLEEIQCFYQNELDKQQTESEAWKTVENYMEIANALHQVQRDPSGAVFLLNNWEKDTPNLIAQRKNAKFIRSILLFALGCALIGLMLASCLTGLKTFLSLPASSPVLVIGLLAKQLTALATGVCLIEKAMQSMKHHYDESSSYLTSERKIKFFGDELSNVFNHSDYEHDAYFRPD